MDRRALLLGRRPAPPPDAPALPSPSGADPDPVRRMPPPVAPPYAGGLAPYAPTASDPWDARRARHLLRRSGYYASPAAIASALGRTPGAVVTAIVDAAVAATLPPVPTHATLFPPPTGATAAEIATYNTANGNGFVAEANGVFAEALALRVPGTGLRERLTLALSGVLTTNYDGYGSRAHRLHTYWRLLRTHALGSYPTLVREMGRTPAMLDFLDGNLNRVGPPPNENYARELLELFTTGITGPDGQPNYTQADIVALARALTGWTTPSASNDGLFVASRFDAGQKTIFGRTGAFGYDEAHDLIFAERPAAVAHRLAGVLYRTFVAVGENAQVVGEIAAVLRANAFTIEPAVRALLGSQHFFSTSVLGARVTSPVDFLAGLAGASGYSAPEAQFSTFRTQARDMGFDVFRPPDVSGWSGGRVWLDTGRMPARWAATDRIWARRTEARALALTMATPADPYALTDELAAHTLAVPLSAATRAQAVEVLLGGIPDYEWDPAAAGSEARLRALLQFLSRLPEAQLA